MNEIIDISLPLRPDLPIWPGSTGFRLTRTMELEAGDPANVSRLDCDVHTGTHVDAPWHFVRTGHTADLLPLHILIGTAVVAHLPHVRSVTPEDLNALALPRGTERLLLRTRNSELWAAPVTEFTKDYVALTAEAAHWITEREIRLVGTDYLSVQRYHDGPRTHEILLEANVIIVEGLNLAHVEPGIYELLCLPLRLVGSDGAPARAVLRALPAREGQN